MAPPEEVCILREATNKLTGKVIRVHVSYNPDNVDDDDKAFQEEIRKMIADKTGWDPNDTEIKYAKPPLVEPVIVHFKVTQVSTGQIVLFQVKSRNPNAVSELPADKLHFMREARNTFAEANGWDLDDTQIEYAKAKQVVVTLQATNELTGKVVRFQVMSYESDEQECFLEEVRKTFAKEKGWDPNNTEIKYAKPPLDEPVIVHFKAILSTDQIVQFQVTSYNPDAVSDSPDEKARFLEEVSKKFADAHDWDLDTTTIEYDDKPPSP